MKQCWKVMTGVLAAMAGMLVLAACPKSGMAILKVESISYAPPGPIHVFDTLTFTANLPEGVIDNALCYSVIAGEPPEVRQSLHVTLHDDGVAPDARAGDRVFTGSRPWSGSYGTGKMIIYLEACGNVDGRPASVKRKAPPLTVLPAKEGEQKQ